jgi:hypothetical protein
LNQYAAVNGGTYSYDPRGNLTSNNVRGLSYDLENRLLSSSFFSPIVNLAYDPRGRMQQTSASSTERSSLAMIHWIISFAFGEPLLTSMTATT